MGTTVETRINSTQAKDAIFKMHNVKSSASEIDGIIREGEFGEVTIKVDTLPLTTMVTNDAAVDIHHQALQGISSVNPAFVVHNYTDSKAMQLDNVGGGIS